MNEKQLSALYKGGIKIGLTIVAMVVLGFLGAADIYKQNAKDEVKINSLATQQLVDNGQVYQEMKAEKQDLQARWSIMTTLALFAMCTGVGYIGWTGVKIFQEFYGSTGTKNKKE